MIQRLAKNLFVLSGAVNTGVLVAGRKALLFDCCDSVTPRRLARLGIDTVEQILCTQHRRPNVAGAYTFVDAGAQLVVPKAERHLFDDVAAYWGDWHNRWHVYHHQPNQVLAKPIAVTHAVSDGDTIIWQGFTIHVLDTPGRNGRERPYLVEIDGASVCFCGDCLYGPGQLWDLYSLQKGDDTYRDYHSFLGNRRKLEPSLGKLRSSAATVLVPSHGEVMRDAKAAIDLTLQRLSDVWRNYTAVSAINYYFPDLFGDTTQFHKMTPAQTHDLPNFIHRVAFTSMAIISQTGAALLIDCGHDSVVDMLQQWIVQGRITSVDACWVTHYHDDHVDGLHRLVSVLGCPIVADRHIAEIIEYPSRFFLPCLSPVGAPVARVTGEGDSWQWHEFKLTAMHLPGQSLYHGGLLVEGRGLRVFFCGDSAAPTGLDDYCAPNRNFLGAGVGMRRCLEIWRKRRPDLIINQHQERAFSFTDAGIDTMEAHLIERERLLAALLPWAHPNFGTDEGWLRIYPYEQETDAGAVIAIDVQFTNHGQDSLTARIEPVLPKGWRWQRWRSRPLVIVPPKTSGTTDGHDPRPDRAACAWLHVPDSAGAGRYIIPFRATWGDRYLGQIRHAIVVVRRPS